MKRLFPICWWPGAVGFLALLFVSLGHPAPRAVALAVLFLPGKALIRISHWRVGSSRGLPIFLRKFSYQYQSLIFRVLFIKYLH